MKDKLDATPLYRRIVTDAWHVAWGHKHLWVFGFFATFIGFGGVSEVLFSAYDKSASFLPAGGGATAIPYLIPGMTTVRALVQFSPNPFLAVTLFLLIMAVACAVFAWIVTISIGALVGSIHRISHGSDARLPEGMKIGAEKFWRVFGVNALAKIIIAGGLFLTSANMLFMASDRSAASALLYVISFIIFTALAVIVSLVAVFATNYAVSKNEPIFSAVDKAWKMLSSHWLIGIEMTIVMFVASLVLGIAALAFALIASVPFLFLILLSSALGAEAVPFVIITVTLGLAVIALALVASLLTTFQVAAWTLLWEELSGSPRAAKLLHLVAALRHRLLGK